MDVELHPAAREELIELPAGERNAMARALEKLQALGTGLSYPPPVRSKELGSVNFVQGPVDRHGERCTSEWAIESSSSPLLPKRNTTHEGSDGQ